MRIRNHLFLAALLVFLAAFMTWGAEPFVLEELHLVHWEQVPEGRPSFTGPVSAAVLMAWHAEHGYPDLLPDLNGDGRTDEEDTILLARDFGEEMGGAIIDDRLADPFIVYPLARYVAERYPDEFRMLIYDESFPEEVVQDLGQPFSPTDVPGIVLDVLEDPFYELYIFHLEELRPGIVGIGSDMPEWNDFTVSRSYIPEELPAGMPVDLVSTGFEQFVPEPVWETIMRLEPERWGFLTPEWIPFETLIILIPQDDVEGMHDGPGDVPGGDPGDDPGDDPGGDPGDDPGGDPGDGPGGDPFDPGGGDQPRFPGIPGREPGGDPGDQTEGVCCMPDGACETTTVDACAQRGGSFVPNETCATYVCPRLGRELCSEVEGEITDICYTFENGVLKVFASIALYNRNNIAARDITSYVIVGLNDGKTGLGGGPDCTDWRYNIDIPGGGTYTYDLVFSTNAPNLDLNNLTYLYGGLWLQKQAPWDCWGILKQDFVQTWDPAPRCTPPGGSSDGGGQPGDGDEGVCCLPDGMCVQADATGCDSVGGAWIAGTSDCASVDCGKILVGDCPKLNVRVLDVCRTVDESDGSVTVHVTAEMENSGAGDAVNVEFLADSGWGFTGPNQTLHVGTRETWKGTLLAGQKVTHSFSLEIGTAPTYATFHPYVTVAAWMGDYPCAWQGENRVVTIDPDGSIALCGPESGGTPPGGRDDGGDSGACCFPDGSCIDTNAADCDAQGGYYSGDGTACESTLCRPEESVDDCPYISAGVSDVCYDYEGPDSPLIVHANYQIMNFGTMTATAPRIEGTASYEIPEGERVVVYEDSFSTIGQDIPPGGTITGSYVFNLGMVPQEPSDGLLVEVWGYITSPCVDYTETSGTMWSDLACPEEDEGGGTGDRNTDPEGGSGTEPDPEPEPEPEPTGLPNLWVTSMTGCWTWSNDGREHVMATVTGVVHNGGQESASNVRARVTANGVSTTVLVGSISAGGQKTVSATIDAGSYDSVSWPLPTSITADPLGQITEADESNNTTNSSFPESSDCN